MQLTLLIISEAKRDLVEVRPHKQLVIKMDGGRKLTLRNRRFVRELDQPPKSDMEPPPASLVTKKVKKQKTHLPPDPQSHGHRHRHLQAHSTASTTSASAVTNTSPPLPMPSTEPPASTLDNLSGCSIISVPARFS